MDVDNENEEQAAAAEGESDPVESLWKLEGILPRPGPGRWASCVRLFNPMTVKQKKSFFPTLLLFVLNQPFV
jgi:hypothetical protein